MKPIRLIVVIAVLIASAVYAFATSPSAVLSSDTTWIEGAITCSMSKPLRVGHAMLYLPRPSTSNRKGDLSATGFMDDIAHPPLTVVPLDSTGNFRLATSEKGLLLLRIASPNHAPLEHYVYCSGGHTIRLLGTPTQQFHAYSTIDTISAVTNDTTILLKRVGKGRYGASIKTKDSVVPYYLLVSSRGSRERIAITGNPSSLINNKQSGTINQQSGTITPDDNGVYWSWVRASKGVAKIQVNTDAWMRACDFPSVTFLSADDATIDSLIARIGHRANDRSVETHNGRSVETHNGRSFKTYNDRSDRVRQVAAIAFGVSWDTLKTVVPPTSIAWTMGHLRFFDLLMQSGTTADTWDYIDTLLVRHPVRRITPPLQLAAVGYAHRSGMQDRSMLLLRNLIREFPDHPQTQDVRDFTDPDRPMQVGRLMPEFDWVTADGSGRRITSNALSGSHTLFFVWDARAQNSDAFNELRRLQTTFQADGLNMVSVFAGKGAPPPSMASFIQTHPWPTVYSDGSPQSPAAMLANRVPFMVLVSTDRKIVMVIGGLNVIEAEKILVQRLRK